MKKPKKPTTLVGVEEGDGRYGASEGSEGGC